LRCFFDSIIFTKIIVAAAFPSTAATALSTPAAAACSRPLQQQQLL